MNAYPSRSAARVESRVVRSRHSGMRALFWSVLVGSMIAAQAPGIATALETGVRQPEIGLADRGGAQIDLAALKGKVVLVDFWASWCAPCKQEMPVLERLYQKYKKDGLVIVAVSVDNESANMAEFLKQVHVSFPVVHDKDHKVADRYKPPRMPSSYVIDRKGIVRHVHGGFRPDDAAKLEAQIKALL